jgi:hypothetical protein
MKKAEAIPTPRGVAFSDPQAMKELKSELAAVEKLISKGKIRSNYYSFVVDDGRKLHTFMDVEEASDDERAIRNRAIPPSRAEILRYEIDESWLQKYVKRNGRKFGLTCISRP